MSTLDLLSTFAAAPFLAILGLLAHYAVKRAAWKHNQRRGKLSLGFCPSSAALGVVFLFAQVFVRPSLDHVIGAVQHEDVDEDDGGELDESERHLRRQLRKIRRGQSIDRLTLKRSVAALSAPDDPVDHPFTGTGKGGLPQSSTMRPSSTAIVGK
jgi:hypothetical protein